jgi:phosphoribosyl 1,2-cyclic phosphate phosphodiesterase
VSEALEVVAKLSPRRTLFTHICHDLPHAATNATLPAGVELAYDGMRLAIASRQVPNVPNVPQVPHVH